MKALVHQLKNNSLSLWWKADIQLSKFKKKISFSDKLSNEMKVEKFRKKLFKLLHEVPVNENEQENWRDKVLSFIKGFESSITGHEESIIDFFMGKGYPKATEEFIHEVKGFDPTMNVYDIFQAIRNVWIMNSIQILFDMKVELTPSVFAYSMLYPYSDNYLDDTRISIEDKEVFNHKFRKWLYGEQAEPSSLNDSCMIMLYEAISKNKKIFSRKYKKEIEEYSMLRFSYFKKLKRKYQKSFSPEDIINICSILAREKEAETA